MGAEPNAGAGQAPASTEPRFTLSSTLARGGVEIQVQTARGIHVNLEAPGTLTSGTGAVSFKAGTATWFLTAVPAEGTAFSARVFLCDDAKTWCKPIQAAFSWQKGQLVASLDSASSAALSVPAVPSAAPVASPAAPTSAEPAAVHAVHYPGAIQQDAEKAFQQARTEGKLVFIDFYGIWCPPCQMLMSEGMLSPEGRALLDKMVVLQLDADSQASWALKSRYQVTGYPTILVTNAAGVELGRMLGFSDREGFVSWLARTSGTGKPMSEWIARRNSGDRGPETLLGLARALSAMGLDEETVPLYQEALPALKGEELVEARSAVLLGLARRGNPLEAEAQAVALSKLTPVPASVPMTLGQAADLLKDNKGKGAAKASERVVALAIQTARAVANDATRSAQARSDGELALGLSLRFNKDEAGAKAAFSRGADLLLGLEKGLTGTGAARYDGFRGQAHALLDLLEEAGRDAEADVWYLAFTAAYPQEFSYHYTYCTYLVKMNRLIDARREAEAALKYSYGDNRLRAVLKLSKVMVAQGDKAGATALLKDAIASTPLPDDPTVRTHRYLNQLKQTLKELS